MIVHQSIKATSQKFLLNSKLANGCALCSLPHPSNGTHAMSLPTDLDYDLAGQRLVAQQPLPLPPASASAYSNLVASLSRYAGTGCHAIWEHPTSGAPLFVGGRDVSHNLAELESRSIRSVVHCEGSQCLCPFESACTTSSGVRIEYFRFPIGEWRTRADCDKIAAGGAPTLEFFEPLLGFVRLRLELGRPVLISCLAGAHRAGAAGVACLMDLSDMSFGAALRWAQSRRPIIQPNGYLPALLSALERSRRGEAPLGSWDTRKALIKGFKFA